MDKNRRVPLSILAAMLATGLILMVAVALPTGASRWIGDAWERRGRPASRLVWSEDMSVDGAFTGMVQLDRALPGEFSDSLAAPAIQAGDAPPPDLGTIDLGLQLSQDGNEVSGYVDLDQTMIFTRVHEVDGIWFGPEVEGTFGSDNLVLTSERITMTVTAEQEVVRQFRLTASTVAGKGNVLSGEYRETVWGCGPEPMTIIGNFRLQQDGSRGQGYQVLLPVGRK